MRRTLFFLTMLASAVLGNRFESIAAAQDYSNLVGTPVLIREGGAKFIREDNEVLAEVGRMYFVDRVKQNKVWVSGQEGWIDGKSVLIAMDATDFFTRQLHEEPTAEKYLSRGQAWAARRNYDRALTDYDSALRLNSGLLRAHTGRGNCLFQQEKYEDAIEAYSRSIAIAPTSATAYNNRGSALRAIGKFEKALSNYEVASKLRPGKPGVIFSLGVCNSALKNYDKAIDAYNAVLEIQPNHADALNERGLAWQRKQDYLKAIASFTAATEANHGHYESMNNLAWLLANCKQKNLRSSSRAVTMATEACKVTGFQNWYCLGTLAASYARDGQFKQAIQIQRKALHFMPVDVSSTDREDYQKRLMIYQAGHRARS